MKAAKLTKKYPIGTPVKYFPIAGLLKFKATEIQSEPWEVCGEVVVKVAGQSGGVSINHIQAAE